MTKTSPEIETAIKAIERWQANRLTSFTPSDILLDFSDVILTSLRSFRVGQKPKEQMRSSGEPEQNSSSSTWTAGIDVLRTYSCQDTQWHLHAIEFHHKVREEAVALRDQWLCAALTQRPRPSAINGTIDDIVKAWSDPGCEDAIRADCERLVEQCANAVVFCGECDCPAMSQKAILALSHTSTVGNSK